jgi:hypothetical protein
LDQTFIDTKTFKLLEFGGKEAAIRDLLHHYYLVASYS